MFKKNGKLLISHRSTTYPCCLPALGDSAGAGRIRLAGANIRYLNVKINGGYSLNSWNKYPRADHSFHPNCDNKQEYRSCFLFQNDCPP
jgi:hypothetical protein